ncbi:MAG: glycerol kinase GlpK [Actinomycetota bacterium]
MSILAIDAGTTGVTALVVSKAGQIIARGYQEFEQHFPKPGWVEHDPEQIWQATLAATTRAIGLADEKPTAIGITNQRETAVIWHRTNLNSPTNAIVWQDRRTADLTSELERINQGDWIRKRTGLNLDPYFTSSKFLWWQKNLPEVWQGVVEGRYALGTIDSYLVARISGGASHITDCSNASRTQLMNLETGQWDDELLQAFGIPATALPTITPSWGELAVSDPEHFLGLSISINGIAGDQQAALFGQAGFEKGDSKSTYGTGAFILTNTGAEIVESSHKLLSTVAWQAPDGDITYASEGSVFVAGAAVQWLRDGLGIIERSSDVEALALEASSSDGVVFVPSLTGLGAPFWNSSIRGSMLGLTRGTSASNIAYATLEAIAFQVKAVLDAMTKDFGQPIESLRVDGGAAANNLLLQIQADVTGHDVVRANVLESTGFGAALLAGLGAGIFNSLAELRNLNPAEKTFTPVQSRQKDYDRFIQAVELTANWS